ncbi:hypothetical protein GQ53DRAFT_836793 [Thozetella sp. PMI_491]|nr:hypothetical protein GQ53DRAFT_836793 [Thozetella sp. PMI_491]
MTPVTKTTRRNDWKDSNFAGSIEWALDLQAFASDDMDALPDRGPAGEEGCISGRDISVNSAGLCEFSCYYGYCPESLCACTAAGPMEALPVELSSVEVIAWDELDVDLNSLCKFGCKYGYCPEEVCTNPVVDEDDDGISDGGMGDSYVAKTTTKTEMVITSLTYRPAPIHIGKHCDQKWSQACFHYSSVMRVSPQWSTLTCPQEAATTAYRLEAAATGSWSAQHTGADWTDKDNRGEKICERDEFPPAYVLNRKDPAWLYAGQDKRGQSIRWIPADENRSAGAMWKGTCFVPMVKDLSDAQFRTLFNRSPTQNKIPLAPGINQINARVTVNVHPEFSIDSWGQSANPSFDDGLWDNKYWPSKITPNDDILSFGV